MADIRENRYILAISCLASFAGPLLFGAVQIALPSMARELAMSAIEMVWVTMGFSLAGAILILPFGRLADIFGRKKIFIIGILINTIAVAITAFSTSCLPPCPIGLRSQPVPLPNRLKALVHRIYP